MLRKRYYILFVARDDDGQIRKISLPLKYVYGLWPPRWWEPSPSLTGGFLYADAAQDRELQPGPPGSGDAAQKLQADGADCA